MSARRTPPLIALRSFEVAARRGSFQAAAEELCVSPTAISHQIRHLEAFYSSKLFRRLHRSVVLTELGVEVARRLHDAFGCIDHALVMASASNRSPIEVTAMPSLAAKWLAPRLHRFESLHPKWSVRLKETDQLVNFSAEDVDVGIRYGNGSYKGLRVEPLMPGDVFAVCSPKLMGGARTFLKCHSDIRHLTLLHDETSKAATGVPNWRTWLAASEAQGVRPDRGPVFGSMHLALEAAIAGHGIALGLAALVADDLATGRLVRPFALQMCSSLSFWIVYSRARAQDRTIRAFCNWLAGEAKDTAATLHRLSLNEPSRVSSKG